MKYLITGVNGQDGFFSAQHFLNKGATVLGISRYADIASNPQLQYLSQYPSFRHEYVPIYTPSFLNNLIDRFVPDRILHCAGFRDIPKNAYEVVECFYTNCDLLKMILNSIKSRLPNCRLLFISSAEIFPLYLGKPCNETTLIAPENDYGRAKAEGMEMIRSFRENDNIFAISAICFNHDSSLSPSSHLVRLVPKKLLQWKNGLSDSPTFYNVKIRRDFGHAKDYIKAFDLMLEQSSPQDLVVATGISTKLQDYIFLACKILELDPKELLFQENLTEMNYDRISDPKKLIHDLGWTPKYDIKKLCLEMINCEINSKS